MIPTETQGPQTIIHAMSQGRLAPILRGAAGGLVLLGIILLYLFLQFRGLYSADSMDQAQIARSIAAGEGFSTKYIRPLALWQLRHAEKEIPADRFPDLSQPPLYPAFNSVPLFLIKGAWKMTPSDIAYAGDRIIAFFGILLFLGSVTIGYFVARRLFDPDLAAVAGVVILVTDVLWQFSLSGLPQILLMLLLLAAALVALRAMETQENGPGGSGWPSQAAIGLLFGLMTLTNWLACWLFFGYLFFAFFYFRPRAVPLAAAGVFVLVLTPWVIRNFAVSGTPFGIAIYPLPDMSFLRTMDPSFDDLFYGFKFKFRLGVLNQMQKLLAYLGLNLAAGSFLLALFHPFKRPATSKFRWCVLAMWVSAIIGMAAYGPILDILDARQLHSIFIPLFAFYGLAFLYVLWNRLGFQQLIFRRAFTGGILFVCSIPMLLTLFAGQGAKINWPPYVPPYIAILGSWFSENEGLCSDMPWAVAWYSQRKCLLLPDSPETLTRISDYDVMGVPIRGLYLTPVSRDAPFASHIQNGEYRRWAAFILGTQPKGLFGKAVALPIDDQCLLYADYERWTRPAP